MNVFGALDNLAWIWVSEKSLAIDQMKIGLGPKCKAVRASFSPEMQDYLSKLEPWFAHIVDFRDALAHRIPLFVPPYCVPDANDDEYMALDARKLATRDADEYERIKAEQLKLVVFRNLYSNETPTRLQDKKPPVVLPLSAARALRNGRGNWPEAARLELNRATDQNARSCLPTSARMQSREVSRRCLRNVCLQPRGGIYLFCVMLHAIETRRSAQSRYAASRSPPCSERGDAARGGIHKLRIGKVRLKSHAIHN